jgi:chaperonin cofactor prefoldin
MERKHEVISASSFKRLKDDIEDFGGQKMLLKNLEKRIEGLTEKVEMSIQTNVDLQEKVAELMLHLTDLVENIQKMVELGGPVMQGMSPELQLPEVSEMPDMSEIPEPEPKDLSGQLKALANQNRELTKTLKSLEGQLVKGSTRDAIKKALEKAGVR